MLDNEPLYQNMLPSSCGPCDMLHVRFMSLPLFTYKSGGPRMLAFNSAKRRKQTHMVTIAYSIRAQLGGGGIRDDIGMATTWLLGWCEQLMVERDTRNETST